MSADFVKMISDWNSRRLLRLMQNLVDVKEPCAIFFAPNVISNARDVVDMLKRGGINVNVICVLDEHRNSFRAAQGEKLVSVEEFAELPVKPKFVFTMSGFFAQTFMDYFARFGTQMITSTNANMAEGIYNRYLNSLPELYAVHEMFADDESKKVFRAYLNGTLSFLLQDFRFAPEPQYFLSGFLPGEGDIAIDGGSYDGANAVDFVRQGAKVFAFEMDAANCQNCLPRAEKFGFTVENLGLSNQAGEAFYSAEEMSSRKVADGTEGARVGNFIDLDSYVELKNLPRVDYIKLDIEGAELDALHGAAKTITRWKPKMAICAYHKREDLWTLPTYIKSLRPDYEFQFRHYKIDCTDYIFNDAGRAILRNLGLNYLCPSECEAVLYCR